MSERPLPPIDPAVYPDGVTPRRRSQPGPASRLAIDAPGADEVGVVPWPLLLRQRIAARVESSDRFPWIVLATSLFGLFTVGFTITILAVSIPRIAGDFGSARATLSWVITGPLLAFGVIGPSVGKVGDLFGHRRIYLLGLLGAAVFAGLTALAWNAGSLIAFRVLGASLGAACGPSSMAMINRVFTRERRVQAMGYWSLVMAGGPVLGVIAGGPIVEQFGWRWIFAGQVPLTLSAVLVAYAVLPEIERAERTPFDVKGTLALAVAASSALIALNRAPDWGWSNPAVVLLFALSPIGAWVFVRVEDRAAHPLLPLDYLRRRNFTFPVLTQFFTNFAYMGGFIITPLLLQDVLGYGETRAGLLSIPRPLTFAVAGPIAGYLAIRVGERNAAVFGASCLVVSMLGLAQVGPASSDWLVVASLALSGVALGSSSPSMAASIANAVEERDLGVAGASQQMMSQIGIVAGIQIMQTVQLARADSVGVAASYSDAYLVGAAVAVLGVLTAAFVRSTKDEPDATRDAPQGVPRPEPSVR